MKVKDLVRGLQKWNKDFGSLRYVAIGRYDGGFFLDYAEYEGRKILWSVDSYA